MNTQGYCILLYLTSYCLPPTVYSVCRAHSSPCRHICRKFSLLLSPGRSDSACLPLLLAVKHESVTFSLQPIEPSVPPCNLFLWFSWSVSFAMTSHTFIPFHFHLLLSATSVCAPCSAFLLCGLWAHGDWQASLWQVWTGAISTHPVYFRKEVSTHVLAGRVNNLIVFFTVMSVASRTFPKTQNWQAC